MAEVVTSNPVDYIKGKLGVTDSGYFYTRNGKRFYRTREESYQKINLRGRNGTRLHLSMRIRRFVK